MVDSMNELIKRTYQGKTICQRPGDGYLNATAMCKAAGKRWAAYRQNETTAEFLAELAASTGQPIENPQSQNSDLEVNQALIATKHGGNNAGTWVHPQVAYHLAQWCSAAFAVRVTEWIHDIRTKGYATGPGIDADELLRLLKAQAAENRKTTDQLQRISAQLAATELRVTELQHQIDGKSTAYLTSLQIAIQAGVPQRHRDKIVPRITAALKAYCSGWEIWPRRGRTWEFPRSAVGPWLDVEGRAMIRAHIDSVTGQGVLDFAAERKRRGLKK